MNKTGKAKRFRFRSAISGRFITAKKAARSEKTSVRERVK